MNENLIGILILTLYFSPVFYQLVIVIKESKRGNKIPLKKFFKFLKITFLILIPLVIGFGLIHHTNYLDYERPIAFDKIDQITFKNFRGIELFKKSLYGNKRFAYIVTSIDSQIDGNDVTIESYFHPSRSFVYNSHSNSKELLTHELYHFKITELYTRKAKKRISEFNNSSIESIKNAIQEIKLEERGFQKKYDYDTFHSYVFGEQKKYEREIDSLLNSLEKFKQPKITIDDKD